MMKAVTVALVLALCSVVLLAGCGQKGPLYLPGEAPESQTEGPFGIDEDEDSGDADQSSDAEQSAPERTRGSDETR